VRYSFTGAIKAPRTVLKDGYISWHDPITNHWMQLRMFPDKLSTKVPHVVDLSTQTTLGALLEEGLSVRSAVDRVTTTARRVQKSAEPVAKAANRMARHVDEATASHGKMLRAEVNRLRTEAQPGGGPAKRARKRAR
jgi:hypothetical protein